MLLINTKSLQKGSSGVQSTSCQEEAVTQLTEIPEHYQNIGIPVKNTRIHLILLLLIYYVVKKYKGEKIKKYFL